MKRINRHLSAQTRAKISKAKKGMTFSNQHKQHLSQALRRYWATIPANDELKK